MYQHDKQWPNSLTHHGIKGQKWGIRRFQNEDGTWTAAGKERYGDGGSDGKAAKGSTRKKIAIGVAAGAAVVAGTVLTAYLVKKYGSKSVSTIADKVPAGQEVFEDIFKSTSIASTPASQIPAPKVEPKQILEKAIKSTPVSSTPTQTPKVTIPKAGVSEPAYEIPQAYNFETLMKQNQDLLKKMYAELA